MERIASITAVEDRYIGSTIDALEKLVERAKTGEVLSFIGIIELRNGKYSQVGPGCPDRHRQAGMLLELAMSRINED